MGLAQYLWSPDVLEEPGPVDFLPACESLGRNAASMSSSLSPSNFLHLELSSGTYTSGFWLKLGA